MRWNKKGSQLAAWTVFAVEALFITMWQAILRPDEAVPTAKNKSFPDEVVPRTSPSHNLGN
jgi:hypothetical protein